jgi:hypothetical protein
MVWYKGVCGTSGCVAHQGVCVAHQGVCVAHQGVCGTSGCVWHIRVRHECTFFCCLLQLRIHVPSCGLRVGAKNGQVETKASLCKPINACAFTCLLCGLRVGAKNGQAKAKALCKPIGACAFRNISYINSSIVDKMR